MESNGSPRVDENPRRQPSSPTSKHFLRSQFFHRYLCKVPSDSYFTRSKECMPCLSCILLTLNRLLKPQKHFQKVYITHVSVYIYTHRIYSSYNINALYSILSFVFLSQPSLWKKLQKINFEEWYARIIKRWQSMFYTYIYAYDTILYIYIYIYLPIFMYRCIYTHIIAHIILS